LVRAVRENPDHPSRKRWERALYAYAYGFFLPACRANPFGIVPVGHYPGQGLIWFAGLWHGANAIYGQAAALAWELSQMFSDSDFEDVATANLQWIAGLHAGITKESIQRGAHMWSADLPDGIAIPASMINGIGQFWVGSWLNIRGAISNGFQTGDQFRWDVPAVAGEDAPSSFSDEDWITHAGSWLSGISLSASAQEKKSDLQKAVHQNALRDFCTREAMEIV
jgi:hypothetical protein